MTEAKKCKINALYLEEVVYVPHQQSISALIALSHAKKGVQNTGPESLAFFLLHFVQFQTWKPEEKLS